MGDMPGMASSEVTSRTLASSRPNVLKNELYPNRNSLTTVGESVRVLPTMTWWILLSSFVPFSARAG